MLRLFLLLGEASFVAERGPGSSDEEGGRVEFKGRRLVVAKRAWAGLRGKDVLMGEVVVVVIEKAESGGRRARSSQMAHVC